MRGEVDMPVTLQSDGSVPYDIATMASISTLAPFGNAATPMAARAGGLSSGKYGPMASGASAALIGMRSVMDRKLPGDGLTCVRPPEYVAFATSYPTYGGLVGHCTWTASHGRGTPRPARLQARPGAPHERLPE